MLRLPGTIALRRTPLAASVRGIVTLNGALMSLGGVGRGFEGTQGLDLQQEHDFVLALAESAGVPSGRCDILAVYTRSLDMQTDVAFEISMDDAKSAEFYSRKIGALVDGGQFSTSLSARGLPGALTRSPPCPFAAGLPLPVGIEGEKKFTGLSQSPKTSPLLGRAA